MAEALHRRQPPHWRLPDRSAGPLVIRELPARPAVPYPATRRNDASCEALRGRIRAEFEDMPGLTLTLPQAQRLFGLQEDVCVRVLSELLQQGFLARAADGQVRRYGAV